MPSYWRRHRASAPAILPPQTTITQSHPTTSSAHDPSSIRTSKSATKFRGLVASVVDELTCPICLDEFRYPRLLQCGHSFCTDCVSAILPPACNTLRCPSCRILTRFTKESAPKAQDLPINYSITKVLDILHGQVCKRVIMCETHKKEDVKFFCKSCRVLLCSECIVSKDGHLTHELVTLTHATMELQEQMKVNAGIVKLNLKRSQILHQELVSTRDKLDDCYEQNKLLADRRFEELQAILNERKREIEDVLLLNRDSLLKNLDDGTADVAAMTSQWSHLDNQFSSMNYNSTSLNSSGSPKKIDSVDLWKTGISANHEFLKLVAMNATKECDWSVLNTQKYLVLENIVHDAVDLELEKVLKSIGTVKISSRAPVSRQIFIRGIDQKTIACNMMIHEQTIYHLMQKVHELTQIPLSTQRLYFQGKLLAAATGPKFDAETNPLLESYGITNESTIHLSVVPNPEPDNFTVFG